MSWKKDFAKGWTEIQKSQRSDRARYVVEEGVMQKHTVAQIVESLAATEWPVPARTVRKLIDHYGFANVAVGTDRPVQISQDQLETARGKFRKQLTIDEEEVEEYADEHGIDLTSARRMFQGEKLFSLVKQAGLIGKEGKVNIKVTRARHPKSAEGKTSHEWVGAFLSHEKAALAFLRFLKSTDQNRMYDPTVPNKIAGLAAEFEEQSERFRIGVSKAKARRKAKVK